MTSPYISTQESILDQLQGVFIPAGTNFSIRVAASAMLTEAQAAYLRLRTRAEVVIGEISQISTRIEQNDEGRTALPPEFGDAEITLAGVPALGGSAAAAVGVILRGLAAVGAAVALVSFTVQSDDIPQDVEKTAKAVSIPIILILLLLLFVLREWNKT